MSIFQVKIHEFITQIKHLNLEINTLPWQKYHLPQKHLHSTHLLLVFYLRKKENGLTTSILLLLKNRTFYTYSTVSLSKPKIIYKWELLKNHLVTSIPNKKVFPKPCHLTDMHAIRTHHLNSPNANSTFSLYTYTVFSSVCSSTLNSILQSIYVTKSYSQVQDSIPIKSSILLLNSFI